MTDEVFDLHCTEIKKLLSSYGQDLATKGTTGQPFGAPEVAMALIFIIGWFLRTTLKVIIEHEVKKRLQTEPIDEKLSSLDARLQKLEFIVGQASRQEISSPLVIEELRRFYAEVTQRLDTTGRPGFTFSKEYADDLLKTLQGLGLTKRRALRLSAEIRGVFIRSLTEAHKKDEQC